MFVIDSDYHEPDGTSANSPQGRWLQAGLKASRSAFQVVAMHHPPYSSGPHGNTQFMQWPYGEWGALTSYLQGTITATSASSATA